ncbi:sugar phosphate isomerase/epimerase [Chloroflexi bacterium TSY]|nr:sugar phosphate isomerase/epimerase [Chloroflexi bacterium TSY]
MKKLPFVGAAMQIKALPQHADWLIENQRDLEIQDALSPEVLDSDWRHLVKEARAALDGYTGRMGVHGPFLGLTIMSKDPKMRALVVDRFQQSLDFGAELGATHMVVHSPFAFFGSPFHPHSVKHGLTTQIAETRNTFDPIVAAAEKIGCILVLENIYDTNPAALRALVEAYDSPYVRRSLDVGHAFVKHAYGGGPTPDLWVLEAGKFLAHLHLQDTDGELDRHWMPGKGNINWYALFEALKTLEQNPRLILELRNDGEIELAANWLAEQGLAR